VLHNNNLMHTYSSSYGAIGRIHLFHKRPYGLPWSGGRKEAMNINVGVHGQD